MEDKKRNIGIDLLKIVLMFMVCEIHILNQGGTMNGTDLIINRKIYLFIYSIFFCAVDAYALISGYMQKLNKTPSYTKAFKLWFQVVFYSFSINIISDIIGFIATRENTFYLDDIIKSLMPLTYNAYWYFNAYFPLCFIMPFLNMILKIIDKKKSRVIISIICLLYLIIYFVDKNYLLMIFNYGYSFLWIAFLYIVGVLIKKTEIIECIDLKYLIVIYLLFLPLNFLAITSNIKNSYEHVSPIVIINGVLIVSIFDKLKINNNKISKLSALSFGSYLFHVNEIVFAYLIIGKFSFVGAHNIIFGVFETFCISLFICITGILIEYYREKLFKISKINQLCEKLNSCCLFVFNKICKIM